MEPLRTVKREPVEGPPKQAPSPAQEATRAHIVGLEAQLRRLRGRGRLDSKEAFQVTCLEEELRKAHSKLKRLLNEAERQRRRRERLRSRSQSLGEEDDGGIMAVLKSCSRFQDFVRELNGMGFTLTRNDESGDNVYAEETMPEVDGVKVQVEMIEGDEELAPDFILNDENSSTSEDPSPSRSSSPATTERWPSYRRWYERQRELQRRWEEGFARDQMELARGLLDSVTATFLQGVQQVMLTLAARRYPPPFYPEPPPPL